MEHFQIVHLAVGYFKLLQLTKYLVCLLIGLFVSCNQTAAKGRSSESLVPVVDSNLIRVSKSCHNSPTGAIAISKVSNSRGQMGYYLVDGNKLASCNYPGKILYANKLRHGIINSGDSLLIESLAEGDYTIVIYTLEIDDVKKFFKYSFHIGKYKPLTLVRHNAKNPSCTYTNDGKIVVEVTGGKGGKKECVIIPGNGTVKQDGGEITFSGLVPEVYDIYISDKCGQTVSVEQVHIKGSAPLCGKLNIDKQDSLCLLKIKLNDNARRRFALYESADMIREGVITTSEFSIDSLPDGRYALSVLTEDSLACMKRWDTLFRVVNGIMQSGDMFVDDEHRYYNAPERKPTYRTAVKQNISLRKGECYIVIEKGKFVLNVFNAKDELLLSYPVVFGNKNLGDKMYEGDRKTPEGTFYINGKRVHDKWCKFLHIDYPNEESYKKFEARKAAGEIPAGATIGGSIGLHGTWPDDDISIDKGDNWTSGCISTKNQYINELYEIIPDGTKVIIKR